MRSTAAAISCARRPLVGASTRAVTTLRRALSSFSASWAAARAEALAVGSGARCAAITSNGVATPSSEHPDTRHLARQPPSPASMSSSSCTLVTPSGAVGHGLIRRAVSPSCQVSPAAGVPLSRASSSAGSHCGARYGTPRKRMCASWVPIGDARVCVSTPSRSAQPVGTPSCCRHSLAPRACTRTQSPVTSGGRGGAGGSAACSSCAAASSSSDGASASIHSGRSEPCPAGRERKRPPHLTLLPSVDNAASSSSDTGLNTSCGSACGRLLAAPRLCSCQSARRRSPPVAETSCLRPPMSLPLNSCVCQPAARSSPALASVAICAPMLSCTATDAATPLRFSQSVAPSRAASLSDVSTTPQSFSVLCDESERRRGCRRIAPVSASRVACKMPSRSPSAMVHRWSARSLVSLPCITSAVTVNGARAPSWCRHSSCRDHRSSPSMTSGDTVGGGGGERASLARSPRRSGASTSPISSGVLCGEIATPRSGGSSRCSSSLSPPCASSAPPLGPAPAAVGCAAAAGAAAAAVPHGLRARRRAAFAARALSLSASHAPRACSIRCRSWSGSASPILACSSALTHLRW